MTDARGDLRRRSFLALAAATAVPPLIGPAAPAAAADHRVAFTRRLPVPPLAGSRVVDGVREFDLELATGSADVGTGVASSTWGVNGPHLGPTLRAADGEEVRIRVRNSLPETTTLHWHGHRVPAAMDGGPHQPIAPGTTWTARWRVDHPAATTWYHPHPHGRTAEHVRRGVYGLFVVEDGGDVPGVPRDYGVDDIPVMVQDTDLDAAGRMVRPTTLSMTGPLGDTLVVNGVIGPFLPVVTRSVRLRLHNASPARTYNFGFADGRAFDMVASDGGLLPRPHRTTRVQLSPAERAEIVVRFSPGETAVLRSFRPDLGRWAFLGPAAGGLDSFDVLQIRVADRPAAAPPPPPELAPAPGLDAAAAAVTRTFHLMGTTINGRASDLSRTDFAATVDRTEVWSVRNVDTQPHNLHVHNVEFAVADVDGAAPPPPLSGWKDTVSVAPLTTVRLVMRFTHHTDPNLPYMYHCHLLDHEDLGMMGQFVVVRPGERPGPPPAHDH